MTLPPITDAALDDRLGFIGTSGSGKTYNASLCVERLLDDCARVVIIDPLDVWWGLRLTPEGKPSRFDMPIFGGARGDLPLNESAGKLIGEAVATMTQSCVISLGGLDTKASERRFMLAFLDALYRKATGEPVHLIFDEADLWAPQNSSEPRLQSLMEQIVRRGRIKGFIPWLITQRPAVLSKDVLSQVDGLIAFKLTSSQDRNAIGAWIDGQADREQGKAILASLPTKQRGEGVVWLPARGILETVSFPTKSTFDSSRTPKRGEKRQTSAMKPLNLDALRDKLAAISDEAKANDPTALKSEIARLTRELAKAEKRAIADRTQCDAQLFVLREQLVAMEGRARIAESAVDALFGASNDFAATVAAIEIPAQGGGGPTGDCGRTEGRQLLMAAPSAKPQRVGRKSQGATAGETAHNVSINIGVTAPQQRILNSLGWWKAFGIDAPQREQVAFIAGYSPSSSGFSNLLGAMRTNGWIEYPAGGCVGLADDSPAYDAPRIPATGEAFRAAVLTKLSEPQRRILRPLIENWGANLGKAELADLAGYSPSSSGYSNLCGAMRSLGFLTYPASGRLRASDWLFPNGA